MNTKLFNTEADGFTSEFSLGGLPIFTEDLQMMQDNSTELFGMLSLLKGWSCVVRGCLVDEINTSANTVKVLPGTVLLNDKMYHFNGYEGTYPFSIVPGSEVIDTRIFKDGDSVDVATTYTTGIRTNFSFGIASSTLESVMPTDLTDTEIYFDPFTAQKASTILKNLDISQNEIKPIARTSIISFSETGRGIVGPTLNWLVGGIEGRWLHLGWSSMVQSDDFTMRNAGFGGNTPGTTAGANDIRLIESNIPKHVHGKGSLGTSGNDGAHEHRLTGGASTQNGEGWATAGDNGTQSIGNSRAQTTLSEHGHTIEGSTGNGTNLKNTADRINVRGHSLYCNMMSWKGYNTIESFYKFNTGIIPYTNM